MLQSFIFCHLFLHTLKLTASPFGFTIRFSLLGYLYSNSCSPIACLNIHLNTRWFLSPQSLLIWHLSWVMLADNLGFTFTLMVYIRLSFQTMYTWRFLVYWLILWLSLASSSLIDFLKYLDMLVWLEGHIHSSLVRFSFSFSHSCRTILPKTCFIGILGCSLDLQYLCLL